ncbi:hypothetical protein L1987_65701 [Smallanthus sonchifolius]|uniref:Uncharacterized protein n=1 Tax=Smallanthus sonchifolius TaxID=185202 RepID=A0ACB9BVC0_9ASTR|nr:hypothetical protein L1987_65701 [Smallanthus sonchifolius]
MLKEVANLKGMVVSGYETTFISNIQFAVWEEVARQHYYSNKHNFDSCSLLEDVESHPDGLLCVQKQLLRDISGNNNLIISNVYEGALQLEKVIQMNKVLIVVDNIDDKDKLSTLFGTKVFPRTQSKIIITTRLLKIDKWFGTMSWKCYVHEVELLILWRKSASS